MDKKPKYRWNSEFITLIKNNICPYCEESLIVKGILKTCQCSFYIKGPCETLAYEVISRDGPIYYGNEDASEICPDCGETSNSFVFDRSRAETTCTCGLVINAPAAYSSYRKISYDSFKSGSND